VLRRGFAPAALTLLLAACFGAGSDSGPPPPEISIDFPASAEAGSVQTMTLTVTNPGPEPMSSVLVTFARVGLDTPIVDAAARRNNPAVVSVDPEPLTVDEAGVVYQFDGLATGESATIEFRLKVPLRQGVAANSVQVSDGGAPNRIGGKRLETTVTA
jgi:hypothetical protein